MSAADEPTAGELYRAIQRLEQRMDKLVSTDLAAAWERARDQQVNELIKDVGALQDAARRRPDRALSIAAVLISGVTLIVFIYSVTRGVR